MNWMPLTARLLSAAPDRVDPYLLLADAIGFADHLPRPPEPDFALPVSIEVKDGRYRPHVDGLTARRAHEGSRFFTGTATMAACNVLLEKAGVVRVQLAQALRPQRARFHPNQPATPTRAGAIGDRDADDGKPRGKVLLGIVDNGCPFAHRDLQGELGTRVLRLWNQEPGGAMGGLGIAPAEFGYGAELTRTELNALMKTATRTGSSSVDEEACYRTAGYSAVFGRQSHGAHTLGLLAGARRWNGRPNANELLLPAAADAASARADVVFVQFPQELMDCVSVASLEHRALDAFRYIWRIGKEKGHERVVISFGYESWLGPHDGTSWFEAAVARFMAGRPAAGPKLEIFMVAGNSKEKKVHAEVTQPSGSTDDLKVHVPPANEVPTFIEIRVPSSVQNLRIQLTPPGHSALPPVTWGQAVAWPSADHLAQAALVMQPPTVSGAKRLALLRIAPTLTFDERQGTAPHGLWSIRLAADAGSLQGVHVYIGRAEADAAAPRRGRQAHFVGRTDKQQIADRRGTLNGHACGGGVAVVGAHHFAEFPYDRSPTGPMRGHSTDYSGAGPTNGAKARPDISVSVEDGIYHTGVLGAGTRSGCVTRLSGTSTAAPLAARSAADNLRPKDHAAPDVLDQDRGLGSSLLDPFRPGRRRQRRSPAAPPLDRTAS